MDNFFNNIKDNLNNRPELDFEDSSWLAMQQKMQPEKQKSSKRFGIWWWTSLLVIPLVISNAWMYQKIEKTNKLVFKTQIQKDTIFKTQIIYQIDTVYKERVIQKPTISSLQNSSNYTSKNKIYFKELRSPKTLFLFEKKSIVNYSMFNNRKMNGNKNDIKNSHPKNNYSDDHRQKNSLASLPSIPLKLLQFNIVPNQLFINQKTTQTKKASKWVRNIQRLSSVFRPKEFHLGAGSGLVYPLNGNSEKQNGESIGLTGNVMFSSNIRLWVNASYFRLHLKTNTLEDDNLNIPLISISNDDLTFENAEADQSHYQFNTGMQYVFNSEKRLRPYLGLGYSIVSIQPYEIEYEYTNPSGADVIIPRDYSFDGLINQLWITNIGLEYHFEKKWYGQIEGYYQTNLGNKEQPIPNILGTNIRLMYKF